MPPTPEPASVAQRFLRSTAAGYSSLLVRVLVTLAARMLLARLILRGQYGTYDLALHVVVVAAAIRDLGLPYQLVRDPDKPYGTVFAFGLLSSIGVTLLIVAAAPLAASGWPELPPILRVYALWIFLDGLAVVPRAFFERELEVGRLAVPEIVRGVVVAGVSVGLAATQHGVWSLVVGDLVGAALFAALVWWRAWGRFPLIVDRGMLPELLRRSRELFFIWVAYYLVTYVDIFIVRAFTDAETVGLYGRAYFLAFLARQILFPRSLMPALVAYRDDPRRLAHTVRVAIVYLLFFQVTSGLFLYFNAGKLIAVFLGGQWGAAVPLLRILCFVPFLDVFTEIGGEVLRARSEDRLWLGVTLLNLISLVAIGVVFTARWSAAGMAYANLLLVGHLVMAWRMSRLFAGHLRDFALDMLLLYAVPVATFGLAALAFAPGWGRIGASALAGLASAALLVPRFKPLFLEFLAEKGWVGGAGALVGAEGLREPNPGRIEELL